jgi:hypothetical protein
VLQPGANVVDPEAWVRVSEAPGVRRRIESRELAVVGGADGWAKIGERTRASVVASTVSIETLRVLLEVERVESIAAAIESQIADIESDGGLRQRRTRAQAAHSSR